MLIFNITQIWNQHQLYSAMHTLIVMYLDCFQRKWLQGLVDLRITMKPWVKLWSKCCTASFHRYFHSKHCRASKGCLSGFLFKSIQENRLLSFFHIPVHAFAKHEVDKCLSLRKVLWSLHDVYQSLLHVINMELTSWWVYKFQVDKDKVVDGTVVEPYSKTCYVLVLIPKLPQRCKYWKVIPLNLSSLRPHIFYFSFHGTTTLTKKQPVKEII